MSDQVSRKKTSPYCTVHTTSGSYKTKQNRNQKAKSWATSDTMHHIRRKRDIQKEETHLPVKFDGITMFCSKKLRNGRSFLQPYPVTRQSSKEQRENSVISRFLKMRIAICDRLNPSRLSISNRCSLCSLCALFIFLFVEGMFAVCALGMGF